MEILMSYIPHIDQVYILAGTVWIVYEKKVFQLDCANV